MTRPPTPASACRSGCDVEGAALPAAAEAVYAGLLRLVDDARGAGVRRVVLVSVPKTPLDPAVPTVRHRRRMEDRLGAAGYEHVVLRFPPFMECWLALVVSSIEGHG